MSSPQQRYEPTIRPVADGKAWELPQAHIRVRVRAPMLRALSGEDASPQGAYGDDPGTTGVLLGSRIESDPTLITVEDFYSLPDRLAESLLSRLADPSQVGRDGKSYAVGAYYRPESLEVQLTEQKLAILQGRLYMPAAVIVVLPPLSSRNGPTLIYGRRPDGSWSKKPDLILPEGRGGPAVNPGPRLINNPAPPKKQPVWQRAGTGQTAKWGVAALGLLALIACGLIWTVRRYSQPGSAAPENSSVVVVDAEASNLNLTAERNGTELRIVWNRRAPAIRDARQGELEITDGAYFRDLPLDREQLVSGSILYSPLTSDVRIGLSVNSVQGQSVHEMVRVLNGPWSRQPDQQLGSFREFARMDRRTPPPAAAAPPLRVVTLPPVPTAAARPAEAAALPSPPLDLAPSPAGNRLGMLAATPVLSLPAPPQPFPSAPAPMKTAGSLPEATALTSGHEGNRITPPAVLVQKQPMVPAVLRARLFRDYTVEVQASLDEQGRVVGIEAPKAKGLMADLTALSVEAVREWRYTPARIGDRAVPGKAVVRFRFPASQAASRVR